MLTKIKRLAGRKKNRLQEQAIRVRHRAIREYSKQNPCCIEVGAAGIALEGWLATEADDLNLLLPETWARFFDNNSIDAICAEHVWEHLDAQQGLVAAKTCYRFLKPGGYLRLAVPDGGSPDEDYINLVKPGGSGMGADDHKILYTSTSFSRRLDSRSGCLSISMKVGNSLSRTGHLKKDVSVDRGDLIPGIRMEHCRIHP